MVDTVLDINKVNIAYDSGDVVRGVDFSVLAGEVFGLVGLNGVGKTTLIKALLGLHSLSAGEIKIFGQDHEAFDAKKDIVYLPERFEPPWFLSGMEFVKFSLKLYGQAFDRDQVIDIAEKLALDPAALDRRVQSYSKGMRQKLGIIGTILTKARFIVLDEPMSGLDPLARTLVKDIIMDLKGHDQTLFICSHILADLDEICQRIAVMDKGCVDFVGTPAALKDDMGEAILERAFLKFISSGAGADVKAAAGV